MVIINVWHGSICPCVCIVVIVVSSVKRQSMAPVIESSVKGTGEKPLSSCLKGSVGLPAS